MHYKLLWFNSTEILRVDTGMSTRTSWGCMAGREMIGSRIAGKTRSDMGNSPAAGLRRVTGGRALLPGGLAGFFSTLPEIPSVRFRSHCGESKNMTCAKRSLRLVALFEAGKGVLVLLTGFGLLAMLHRDVHQVAVELVQHFHLNPASHYPQIFLNLMDGVNDARLWGLSLAALAYAVVRIAEGVGLWRNRRWAEWFGTISGALYVPLEVYELFHGLTWLKLSLLAVNLLVVGYLGVTVSRR